MKNFLKKITGIEKLERERAEAERLKREEEEQAEIAKKEAAEARRLAREAKKAAKEAERIAKLSPKELATERGEPWVDVLEVHANQEDISHGFFELDWNDLFIVKLRNEGYGADGDTEEEIVDRWFRQVCYNIASDSGINMSDRSAGYINVKPLANNKSEIS